eukprot:2242090-Pyramimonas_sp.AAC.1
MFGAGGVRWRTAAASSIFDRLFPVCAVAEASACNVRELHEAVANLIQWSSEALELGRWPDVGMNNGPALLGWRGGHRGKSLADGRRGAFNR